MDLGHHAAFTCTHGRQTGSPPHRATWRATLTRTPRSENTTEAARPRLDNWPSPRTLHGPEVSAESRCHDGKLESTIACRRTRSRLLERGKPWTPHTHRARTALRRPAPRGRNGQRGLALAPGGDHACRAGPRSTAVVAPNPCSLSSFKRKTSPSEAVRRAASGGSSATRRKLVQRDHEKEVARHRTGRCVIDGSEVGIVTTRGMTSAARRGAGGNAKPAPPARPLASTTRRDA